MRAADQLSRSFVEAHPSEAASILEHLQTEEASALLDQLPPSTAALGLQGMTAAIAAECLAAMSDAGAGTTLGALRPEVAGGLLRLAGDAERERLLSGLSPGAAEVLRRGLRHRQGTAGALVDHRVRSLPEGIRAGDAVARLRGSTSQAHYYVYVVDREERLVGVLTMRQLMQAPPEVPLSAVMNPQVAALSATADRGAILAHPGWSRVHALPVVDTAGLYMGVLPHESLRRLEEGQPRLSMPSPTTSAGLAFADLCWTGMARLLGGVAGAVLGGSPRRPAATGARDGL